MLQASQLPTLPPNNQLQQIKAFLTFSLQSVHIVDGVKKPLFLRVKFWGAQRNLSLKIGKNLKVGIVTSNQIFLQYLNEMKILPVQVLDQRNNEQLGYGVINWLMYTQNVKKDCPFFDEELNLNIDIKNTRKKHVGQVGLSIAYEKVKQKKESIEKLKEFQTQIQKEYELLKDSQKIQKEIKQKGRKQKKQSITSQSSENPQKGMHEQSVIWLKSHRNRQKNEKISNFDEQNLAKTSHQIEMAQLKLEAYEFFNEPLPKKQAPTYEFLQIESIKMNKKGQIIEFLDIFHKSLDGEEKHHRIYTLNPKTYEFRDIIMIQARSNIDIVLGSEIGFVNFSSQEFKKSKQFQVTNKKNQILGKINIQKKRNVQPNFEKEKIVEKEKIIKKQNKIQNSPPKKEKPQAVQSQPSFLLITVKDVHLKYPQSIICIKNYTWSPPYKDFQMIPMNELGKRFAIQIRSQENEILGYNMLPSFSQIPIVKQSLRCLVVHENKITIGEWGNFLLKIQLGNIKQVNETLNKMRKAPVERYERQITEIDRKPTEEKENQSQKNRREIYKKIQTESNPRIDTEPISEYKLQEEQPQQSNQVYLVEMLSRFLHNLKLNMFPANANPTTKSEFDQLLTKVTDKDNLELGDIISDIFVAENDKIDFEEFLKCAKSYHNFLQLWWSVRAHLLTEIIKSQPHCEQKIQSEGQLGIISRSALWKRALPRTPLEIRNKFEKSYNLTDFAPLNVKILLEDLAKARSQTEKVLPEPEPQLISDLGKLIKETIQELIIEVPVISYEQVNIRVMLQIMNEIGIKISFWESLMIIQQLKGWYGVDMDLGEGIISSITVETWIKSLVSKKEKIKENEVIKTEPKQEQKFEQKIEKLISQPAVSQQKEWRPKSQLHENKSAARSELNEDQIFNIANLLRENDNFKIYTIESSMQKQGKKEEGKAVNILQQHILDSSLDVPEEFIQRQSVVKSTFLKVQVKNIKIKQQYQKLQPFKFEFQLFALSNHYYYLKEISQLSQKVIVQELQPTWMKESKGAEVRLSSNFHKFSCFGILPIDELVYSNTAKTKTIILYEGKNIIGKAALVFEFHNQKPIIHYSDKTHSMKMILKQNEKNSSWNQIIIKIPESKTINCSLNECFDIQLPPDYYKDELEVVFDGIGSCLIPLQQLYLSNKIEGQFPLVSEEQGKFICNIDVAIFQETNLLNESVNNKLPVLNSSQNQPITELLKNVEKDQLIILDDFCSLQFNQNNKVIFGHLLVRNAKTNQILFRSDSCVEHELKGKWNRSSCGMFFKNTFLSHPNIKYCMQIEYQGRKVGHSLEVKQQAHNKYMARFKMHNNSGIFQLSFREIQLPPSAIKFNLNRLISVIQKKIPCSSEELQGNALQETTINSLKQKQRLTLTEMRLLRDIIGINGIDCFALVQRQQVTEKMFTKMYRELTFNDTKKTGYLDGKLLREICDEVGDTDLYDRCYKQEGKEQNYMFLLRQMSQKWQERESGNIYLKVDKLYEEIKKKYN